MDWITYLTILALIIVVITKVRRNDDKWKS
jgi:hypothetical protein